jgi:hypothetical protein
MKPIVVAFVLSVIGVAALAAEHHGSPAPAGVVSLDVYAEGGRVHLLTVTRADGGRVTEYVRSEDGGATWSPPVRVGEGQLPAEVAHRGMDAQLAAAPGGRKLVAVWTAYGKENRFGRGRLVTAVSSDGGKTWHAGPNPADDGSEGDHAFADVATDDAGTFHLAWLDARAGGRKGLLYARSDDGGATWSPNVLVKRDTCECCWTTIATAPAGKVFILFRDKDPRDMAVVRSDDGGGTWNNPVRVGAFDWDFGGCPHVGGGLAVTPAALHAVVWTGKPGSAGSYALSCDAGGARWSDPASFGAAAAHPDIAATGAGRVAAVWDAMADGGNGVFAATSDGHAWSQPRRLSDAGAAATHPRVVTAGDAFLVVWTEQRAGRPAAWVAKRIDE